MSGFFAYVFLGIKPSSWRSRGSQGYSGSTFKISSETKKRHTREYHQAWLKTTGGRAKTLEGARKIFYKEGHF